MWLFLDLYPYEILLMRIYVLLILDTLKKLEAYSFGMLDVEGDYYYFIIKSYT